MSKREKEKKPEFEHIEGREQKMREKEHTQTHTHTHKKRDLLRIFFFAINSAHKIFTVAFLSVKPASLLEFKLVQIQAGLLNRIVGFVKVFQCTWY